MKNADNGQGNQSNPLPKNTSAPDFLKTDGGKTKSNAIEIPSISLPKGGGAIKGIDEKFSINAVNGTASFSIPLPVSPARGVTPTLNISYNSGSGNGIFGLGWNLGLSSIKRKTDKGLPQYFDLIDSDTYLFSEAEDLVPAFKKQSNGDFELDADGEYIINERDTADGLYTIRNYKPRIEGLFAKIERWYEKATGIIKWRIIDGNNVTTLYGWNSQAVIADPQNDKKIFEWLPEFVFDDKGNCCHYKYKKEDDTGFDPLLLHNRNRFINGNLTYTNTYPEKILYGNKTPYKKFGDPLPADTAYLFQVVFDYSTLKANDPVETINAWDYRADAFSDHKAGFETRTTRLCKRVLLFHHFTGPNEYNGLVRSLNFNYDTATEPDFTFLQSITQYGYIKKGDGSYSSKSLPPIEFEYQQIAWNKEVKTISADNLVHAPAGIFGQPYQFTDLYNEGLSGILTEQNNGWYYKHNLGNGEFEQAKLVSPKPSYSGLSSQFQLVDLDADGSRQLAGFTSGSGGFFELNDDNEWEVMRPFEQLPNIDMRDPNTRMIDLNGDGKADLLITEDNIFTWYGSAGRQGFSNAFKVHQSFDEELSPKVVFADPLQTVFLADMTGDGMTDIVRIRNGEVCYWSNLGYGKFGTKVCMDQSPVFDHPDSFNPAFIRLADIDGSGTTDIIYLGKNKFSCWKNCSGNRFSTTPFEIDLFPELHDLADVTVTDLLGNGVACIVWSGSLLKEATAPLQYIDLMNSKKPHLLVKYSNNLGKEVALAYTPSTAFYLEDKKAGRPWITKLHFPVHCISKTETVDKISGWRFVSSYKYHHGYYDHPEREFRGFGMVEQTDSEDFEHWVKGNASNIVDATLHQEPVITKQWFHTGAFLRNDKILTQFEQEYWYSEMNRQGFPVIHHEHALPDAVLVADPNIDPGIIDHLSPQEWREAYRACKGMGLRNEVFALDAVKFGNTPAARQKELTPFTVTARNCVIELLQPKGKNRYAVFAVKESEAISYNYERNTDDPHIAHTLNIQLDEYGNVLEAASVVYPRLQPDISLPLITQNAQHKTGITFNQNRYTNDVFENDVHRLRLPAEIKTFELQQVSKTGSYYALSDFDHILDDARSSVVAYHELDVPPVAGKAQRRLIEQVRNYYYKNDVSGPLPLYKLGSLALPFHNFQLVYTPALLTDIFAAKASAATLANLMTEGKFAHSLDELGMEDTDWWIPSGTAQYITGAETVTDAQNRFFVPVSFTDQYKTTTKLSYYSNYFLLVQEMEDELQNKTTVEQFNFRTLQSRRMKDMNNNLSEAISDELGIVKAIAVMGKDSDDDGVGEEADDLLNLTEVTEQAEKNTIATFFTIPDTPEGVTDSHALMLTAGQLLQHATARFVYDFDVFANTGKPAVIASIVREEHFKKNNNAAIQVSFEYSNGLGAVVMKKAQAEPGPAKKVTVHAGNTYTITEIDTAALDPVQLRWVGSGRTVINNKGNAVKQYEPFFSVTPRYEDLTELVETGVTPLLYYDAPGRLIKTRLPDGTFTKVEFDAWKFKKYDANDTILDAECTWYVNRTNRLIDAELISAGKDPAKEKIAADQSGKHANTPAVFHVDSQGRPVLSVEHNKNIVTEADEFYKTKIVADIEGNLRTVYDARELIENGNLGNMVMQYKYDMLGNPVYQKSMDAGQRWMLFDVLGNPLRSWDERNHEFQYFYDVLHRPVRGVVTGGDGPTPLNHIFDRIFYGETTLNPESKNLRGKITRHYDTGGLIETPEYNFKGQALANTRQLFKKYKEVANWTDANLAADLETEAFTFSTETDALGRIIKQTAPDKSLTTFLYNAAGLLNGQKVNLFDPDTSTYEGDKEYITNIDYNEKGQRNKIVYGNNVRTDFLYDAATFRLIQLTTKRGNNDPLQDWRYTFDPVGNITHIEDKNIPVVFFDNSKITGVSEYSYDAVYRLRIAKGRENDAALAFGSKDNWNDAPFIHSLNPGDAMTIRNYQQAYDYDEAGNMTRMQQTLGNNWTRIYQYEKTNNRLTSTGVGAEVYNYTYHLQHGFITAMPHLEEMEWNFKEQLAKSIRQKVNPATGTPETTYYQYDGGGMRIRKITENAAAAGAAPTLKEERIYISSYELYKKHSAPNAGLQRRSLSLLDDGHRFVIIETRNAINDGTEKQLTRYQLHNHLGSACMELDGTTTANVISYEEYHPYGTTAYQANNATIKAAAKRYRYTGMERDEETGFNYHTARYYLPWLGRWLSADPIGIKGGINLYAYASNNPIMANDVAGTDPKKKPAPAPPPKPTFTPPTIKEKDGHIETQTITFDGKQVEVEFIKGTSNKTVLIVGGVHQDEEHGRKLANELYAKLRSEKQYYNIILIPDLFGDRTKGLSDKDKQKFRQIGGLDTNTGNFPNQKETLADSAKRGGGTPTAASVDHQGTAVPSPAKILPENVILISILEKYKDKLSFTLSIHDHSALNLKDIGNGAPGFYLDQKAGDDAAASKVAKNVVLDAERNGAVVEGNYLGSMVKDKYVRGSLTSDYPNATAKQGTPGVSFGTYGSSLGLNQYLVETSRDNKASRRTAWVNAITGILLANPNPPIFISPGELEWREGPGKRLPPWITPIYY